MSPLKNMCRSSLSIFNITHASNILYSYTTYTLTLSEYNQRASFVYIYTPDLLDVPRSLISKLVLTYKNIIKLASWFWKVVTSPPPPPPPSSISSSHPSSKMSQDRPSIRSRKISSPPAPPSLPNLTPQFCFNTRLLQDFLRISRSQLDDTINTSLNSLLTPGSTSPFDPSTNTSSVTNLRPASASRRPIPTATCTSFLNSTLLPTWSNRTKVLTYCSLVAASPDPDDPDLAEIRAENAVAEQRKVNERLDPYSGRFFPKEARTEVLASILRNENAVERIVRERTWRIIQDRCEDATLTKDGNAQMSGKSWEEALDQWRKENGV